MSEKVPLPTNNPLGESAPSPEEAPSHSTRSVQETADYTPIVVAASGSGGSSRSSSKLEIAPADRYQVRRLLGSGGFGTVSLAYDELIQREVAIKRPASNLSEQDKLTFLHEAQLAAKVKHPGIITVHDVGVDPFGEPFIVYEFLAGDSLKAKLKGEPWSVVAALRMAIALADALAAAHGAGLTHRDLKPANILLDAHGRPQIADFGLAVEESGQQHLRGQVAGTYRYMSPEQVRGESHLLDGRADLWSLGVILYELLTGKHPFPASQVEAIQEQILTRDPRPPRQWVSAIPNSVEAIVLKLLARSVKERYASAAEVSEELRRALELEVRPGGAEVQTISHVSPAPRFPLLIAASSLVAVGLAVCALVAVVWFIFNQPGQAGTVAKPEEEVIVEETRPFTDADFSSGSWSPPLLNPRRGPGEIYFSPSARRTWGPEGNLLVESKYLGFLELGTTVAPAYTLELRFAPRDWLGSAGMFVGYGPIADQPELAAATLLSVREQEPGKATFTISRIELRRGGEQTPKSLIHAPSGRDLFSVEAGDTVSLMVEVADGKIWRLYINHAAINSPLSLSRAQYPCQGKFGLYTLGGDCNFVHCRIRITP